jgi:hypothetical protein
MARVPVDNIGGLPAPDHTVHQPVPSGSLLDWLKEIAPDVYDSYVNAHVPHQPVRDMHDADFNKRRPGYGRIAGHEGTRAPLRF